MRVAEKLSLVRLECARVYSYDVISNAPTSLKKRHRNWCVRATQDVASDGIKTMKKVSPNPIFHGGCSPRAPPAA